MGSLVFGSYDAAWVALHYPDATVTAIDISNASLDYAFVPGLMQRVAKLHLLHRQRRTVKKGD
jgi:hypothetical protein